MKVRLLYFLISLPFCLLAQESIQSTHRLALVASPDISYFAGNHPGTLGRQEPRLGFRVRVDGELQLSKKIWMRLGAGYAQMNYKREIVAANLQWPNQNSNGQYDPNLPGENVPQYLRSEDKMIILPLALRCFWNKHLYSDLEMGANFIFVQSTDDLVTRPNFGCAFGWQKAIGARTFLFVQPAFRFILNNAFKGSLSTYNQHPYSIGLETGIRGFLK